MIAGFLSNSRNRLPHSRYGFSSFIHRISTRDDATLENDMKRIMIGSLDVDICMSSAETASIDQLQPFIYLTMIIFHTFLKLLKRAYHDILSTPLSPRHIAYFSSF